MTYRTAVVFSIIAVLIASPRAAEGRQAAGESKPPVAPKLSGGVQFHRARAGTPNAVGWYEAKSTEGHFRVSLPIPFNDSTTRAKNGDKPESVSYVVGCASTEGVKFLVTEMPRRDNVVPANAVKDFARITMGGRRDLSASERAFEFDGHPAIDRRASSGKSTAVFRFVALPDRAYLMCVEYPTTLEAQIGPMVPTFLDSLVIEDVKPAEKDKPAEAPKPGQAPKEGAAKGSG